MRTPAESDRYFAELAAARAEKARHPTPAHEMARATAGAMGVKVPSHEQVVGRMAREEEAQNEWQRGRGVDPVPASPDASCNICNPEDFTSDAKPADLETKGVKRQLAALTDLLARHINSDNIIHAAGECPVTGGEDGSSDRPVHDPAVPYVDLPGDEVQSLPFQSTAPVEAAKRFSDAVPGPGTYPSPKAAPMPTPRHGDLLDVTTVRNGFRPNPSSFTLTKLEMEAQRNAGNNLPSRPGCAPAPRPVEQLDPADIHRAPLTDGHAAAAPGAEHLKANPGHTNAVPAESPCNAASVSVPSVSTERPDFKVSTAAPSFSKPSFDNVARKNPE